jgi:threonine dehydratase
MFILYSMLSKSPDHPDIILGQGTLALEFEQQVKDLGTTQHTEDSSREGYGWRFRQARDQQRSPSDNTNGHTSSNEASIPSEGLDCVIAPCGGGGMLSGVATALHGTGITVFGAEPSFEGCDDARRGLHADPPTRVEFVKSLTIADGLRTPVGKIPWSIISDKSKVRDIFSVSEDQIKAAMRLLLERMKVVVEPSAAVPLAVALYDETFRKIVEREAGEQGWNVGIVLSGGNTTIEAIGKLFAEDDKKKAEREAAMVGKDGKKVAENVAG